MPREGTGGQRQRSWGRRQSCWLRTAGGFAVASCWAVHKRRTFREQWRRVHGRFVLNTPWRTSIEDPKTRRLARERKRNRTFDLKGQPVPKPD
jgi:hypothetical protein